MLTHFVADFSQRLTELPRTVWLASRFEVRQEAGDDGVCCSEEYRRRLGAGRVGCTEGGEGGADDDLSPKHAVGGAGRQPVMKCAAVRGKRSGSDEIDR